MTDRELMQQALEALDWAADCIEPRTPHNCDCPVCVASDALRERLADNTIHSCSYYCERPECVKAQRDELRERLAQPERQGLAADSTIQRVPAQGTLLPAQPETIMAEYKFQTYAAYKTDGEMKIGVVPEQEPVAYDKTEINCFAQDLYDQKMREGKRGHYESMFHVIHQCIKKVSPPASKPWVGLTDEERDSFWRADQMTGEEWRELFDAIEAKLKEKNA